MIRSGDAKFVNLLMINMLRCHYKMDKKKKKEKLQKFWRQSVQDAESQKLF
jgi:hypothetical protein